VRLVTAALAGQQDSPQRAEASDPGFQLSLSPRIAVAQMRVFHNLIDRGPQFGVMLHDLLRHQGDDPVGMTLGWCADRMDFRCGGRVQWFDRVV
jgi:hypothetical protein